MYKLMLVLLALLFCGCGKSFESMGLERDDNSESKLGYVRIDDMLFHESEIDYSEISASGASGFGRSRSEPWKNGIVPVRFKNAISEEQRKIFFDACNEWSKRARVTCVTYSGQEDRIDVTTKAKDGCWSQVGRGPGIESATNMNLGSGCWSKGVIVHELGHSFGLIHEHQRPDRDLYVRIIKENIKKDKKDAFDRLSSSVRTLGPYDFYSIMHYGSNYFSKNGLDTIEPRENSGVSGASLGETQRTGTPTDLDGQALASIYGQPEVAPSAPAVPPVVNPPPANYQNILASGANLMPDDSLYSDDGASQLIYQLDGNLVLYRFGVAVWSSGTFGNPGNVWMQMDGNLIIFNSNSQPIWESGTAGNTGATLHLQGDGNLVIYATDSRALWNTGTNE